jgi:hypothetical protein
MAAAALAALACLPAAPAVASPPRPADLRVIGGEEWHPEPDFGLQWTNPPTGGAPLAGVRYRVRDPLGTTIVEAWLSWATEGVGVVSVPRTPGAYTAEVWLEDTSGTAGPTATAMLRFDDRRPTAIAPPEVPAWIGRTAFPLTVQLGPPPGPAPLSGIRGYAVAIDSAVATEPCAAPDRCSLPETTLRGGEAAGALRIAGLPEGTSHLHAVPVSGSGMKSATAAHVPLRVDVTDPVTRLQGAPAGWVDHPVRLTASASDAGSGMEPDGPGSRPFTAIQVDGGPPAITPGATAAASVVGNGTHAIAHYARDAAGNVNDGGGGNGIANRPPVATLVRIDRGAPRVAFVSSQDPRDPELIRAHVADPLSGPDLSRGWIGMRLAGSGDRFQPLPALPQAGDQLRARWDSDADPPGEYEFCAVGYDLAGNATTAARRANGTAMVLPNPLKAPTALRAAFAERATARTVPFGRGVRLSGQLSAAGTPLPGMPVRIVERFVAGASPAIRVSMARTGPGGAFALRLAPGPSREIEAGFEGDPTLSRTAGSPLSLHVRSRVRLRTSAAMAAVGGRPLVFSGQVVAGPGEIPAGGKSVQLQFRLRGIPWSEFRTVQTDRRGRFRHAYRFSDDDSRGARFQFRAYAPAQDDWPYEPGGSRPLIVRGR